MELKGIISLLLTTEQLSIPDILACLNSALKSSHIAEHEFKEYAAVLPRLPEISVLTPAITLTNTITATMKIYDIQSLSVKVTLTSKLTQRFLISLPHFLNLIVWFNQLLQ